MLSNSILNNAAGGIVLVNGGNNSQVSPTLTSALVFPDRLRVEGRSPPRRARATWSSSSATTRRRARDGRCSGAMTVPSHSDESDGESHLHRDGDFAGRRDDHGGRERHVDSRASRSNPAPGDTSAFSTAAVLVSPFVVTNTNDSGIGSLRFAIQSANNDVNNDDTITFRIPTPDPGFIPSTGSWTIPVLSLLAIAKPTSEGSQHVVVIDGLTQQSQPGAATTHPVVEITPGPRYTGNGLEVTSGGNTVRGLVIGGFQGAGMLVDGSGATGNLVTGNFIGTDVTGTTRLPNRFAGVRLGGSSNTVSSNLISGNTSEGVFVIGRGDQVLDNRIGTDAAGTTALGNGLSGITIRRRPTSSCAGIRSRATASAKSRAAGSSSAGRERVPNLIVGNFIGTDAAGTRRSPTSPTACLDLGSLGNTIGGTAAGARETCCPATA